MIAAQLTKGAQTATFRPRGNSMHPIIKDGEQVTVARADHPEALRVGDVVLAKVRGQVYLHKVTAVDHERERVQIGNNHGHINGWTSYDKIYGLLTRE